LPKIVLHPSFFSKNTEISLSRMRLFGYIASNDIRDDERTIWCHAH
jgi:hypothetical protein